MISNLGHLQSRSLWHLRPEPQSRLYVCQPVRRHGPIRRRDDRPLVGSLWTIRFSQCTGSLTLCDGGGSNGWRSRLWKLQLQEQLADRLGLEVMVCHYPKNASKWNPIEHRLFGPVSLNWAGKPFNFGDNARLHSRDHHSNRAAGSRLSNRPGL